MRLIDADAFANRIVSVYGEDGLPKDASLIYELLLNRPTIDAEPVVRCKNCKHYIPSKEMPDRGWCDDALQNLFKEDFYCGFGKRREP